MPRIRIAASLVSLLGIASLARADFHDWRINEVFSDASGNVQFIKFSNTLENGEEFLSGHVLSSNSSSLTFPTNLPSDQTLDKFFLVATAGFANLSGAPTPDFTIPANFLNTSGDTINYTGVDSLTFASLPVDGKTSLLRDLSTATNSPTNFAGVSGSVTVSPPSGVPLPAAAIPGAIVLLGAAVSTRTRRAQRS